MITSEKMLRQSEVNMLLEILDKYPGRNSLIIGIALFMGLRASEILKIRVKDYCFETRQLVVRTLKGGPVRELPVPPRLALLLEAEIDKQRQVNGSHVFPISYKRLWQIWDEYRPVKKSFHALRHTFAVGIYKKSGDIRLVKACLGHRSLNSTEVYLDWSYSMDEIRKVIA